MIFRIDIFTTNPEILAFFRQMDTETRAEEPSNFWVGLELDGREIDVITNPTYSRGELKLWVGFSGNVSGKQPGMKEILLPRTKNLQHFRRSLSEKIGEAVVAGRVGRWLRKTRKEQISDRGMTKSSFYCFEPITE